MVFDSDVVFEQFLHCKFRDNVVRLLVLPYHTHSSISPPGHKLLLGVTKWGGVGIYSSFTMGLLHTFCLDMEQPNPDVINNSQRHQLASRLLVHPPRPKCRQSHLVVDAVSAEDIRAVIFATTKGILQCYDTGELEEEDLGLGTLPRGQFFQLTKNQSPLVPRNFGFVETHRITGLESVPSCLAYYLGTGSSHSKLLIGQVDGVVLILEMGEANASKMSKSKGNLCHPPFGGRRKVRGVLTMMRMSDLYTSHRIRSYRGHHDPVKEIIFLGGSGRLSDRELVLSVSRDPKFSLFCEDYTGISESFIISLPKGVNTVTASTRLSLIVTGSEDGIVRCFSQFSMKMPQMELSGHRGAIVGLTLLPVQFDSEGEILLSYSEDVEIRAWDPVTFVCLQSIYIRFPGVQSSTIMCKTPEFAHVPLILVFNDEACCGENKDSKCGEPFILLLYCNAYAKLGLDQCGPALTRAWPFVDFDLNHLVQSKPSKTAPITWNRTETGNPRDPKSISLDLQEMVEMKNKAEGSMNSLLRHKYYEEEEERETESRQKSLTALAMSRLESLQISGGRLENELLNGERKRTGSIFDKLPLHQIKPIPCPSPPKYYLGEPQETLVVEAKNENY